MEDLNTNSFKISDKSLTSDDAKLIFLLFCHFYIKYIERYQEVKSIYQKEPYVKIEINKKEWGSDCLKVNNANKAFNQNEAACKYSICNHSGKKQITTK